ncbi:MAG TPA: SRPBCC domain-containing protein [Candidatus Limnocylindrales bacterium]|nr:SRPBCC domain-containing protein [Candidatus Limnocylindrales bacterium]
MSDNSYTTAFVVDRTPVEVFAAIGDVRAWWSGEIDGETDRLGGEFRYRYRDLHDSSQKITEWAPGRRIVWHVTDAHLSFVDKAGEWKGTDIIFDLVANGGGTEVRFTHVGLAPQWECYDACSNAWSRFINGNLRGYITTGKVQPNPFE